MFKWYLLVLCFNVITVAIKTRILSGKGSYWRIKLPSNCSDWFGRRARRGEYLGNRNVTLQPICSQFKKAVQLSSLQSHFISVPFRQNQVYPMLQLGDMQWQNPESPQGIFKGLHPHPIVLRCANPRLREHIKYIGSHLRRRPGSAAPDQCRNPEEERKDCKDHAFFTEKTNVHMLKDIQPVLALQTKVFITLKEKTSSLKKFTGALASQRMFSKLFEFEANYCIY